MMNEDLESRIKALEEKLTVPLDKMSTMKATNRLKQYLDGLKKGTQEEAVWLLIDEAEKVPDIEKENSELRAEAWTLQKDNRMLSENVTKLKKKLTELEAENAKLKMRVGELEDNFKT